MRITSSKHADYAAEFNDQGMFRTDLLNQVASLSLPEFVTVQEALATLKAMDENAHAYAKWLTLYITPASRFKRDTVLPDAAYWAKAVYQEIAVSVDETDQWVWNKLDTEGMDVRDFVAMDVETTGLSREDSIIQLSAVKFKDGQIVDEFDLFVSPSNDKPISSTITDITGITQEDVTGQARFNEVVDDFLGFIGDLTWVGHNIGFDIRMFESEMTRAGLEMPDITSIDTLTVTKDVFPFWPSRGGAYKLENIKHRLAPELIKGLQSHNSLDDSKMCGWWLLELQKEVAGRA